MIPTGPRPARTAIFDSITVNYKLFLNILATLILLALFWRTRRRGATDPVCQMKVDRAKATRKDLAWETLYFLLASLPARPRGCASKPRRTNSAGGRGNKRTAASIWEGSTNCHGREEIVTVMSHNLAVRVRGSIEETTQHGERVLFGFRPAHRLPGSSMKASPTWWSRSRAPRSPS